jgi:glycosyltransferase involved in cell wall biosynthesis
MNGSAQTQTLAKTNGTRSEARAMKGVVLYPCPVELDGVSLQGELLYQGLLHNKYKVVRSDFSCKWEKEWVYKTCKPDVAIGVGYWGNTPELVLHPQKFGVQPVPWFNADGWVANYVDVLNELPLIFTTSKWVKDVYIRDGVNKTKIVPMPIGIDTDEMSPLPQNDKSVLELRKMLGIEPDEKMILTIGGDTTSKGFQEVLMALGKIGEEFENWKYVGKSWLNGSPYYHRKEEFKIMKDYGIRREKIVFIDGAMSREFVCKLMNACDIYAAPSRIEGFGMLQVEAQSCKKPVLGIDAMGVKDTVVHGKTGYLAKVGKEIKLEEEWVYRSMGFPEKMKIRFDQPKTFDMRADIDDIKKYLLKMLTDDELCKKMGEAGRINAVENFDYRKVSLDLARTIEKELKL